MGALLLASQLVDTLKRCVQSLSVGVVVGTCILAGIPNVTPESPPMTILLERVERAQEHVGLLDVQVQPETIVCQLPEHSGIELQPTTEQPTVNTTVTLGESRLPVRTSTSRLSINWRRVAKFVTEDSYYVPKGNYRLRILTVPCPDTGKPLSKGEYRMNVLVSDEFHVLNDSHFEPAH